MNSIVKQVIGYIITVLIVACIIWFAMYKYNEKIQVEQSENNIEGNSMTVTKVV